MEPIPFGDKYVLVEHIATGGMAEIYRAQYTGIEGFAKELVVKRMRPEFAAREDVVNMFLHEARVAATLSHNNIVHTYDLGEIADEYFIAMELLKGQELVEVLRQSVKTGFLIPLDLGIGIIMQSLEGLHYAHSRVTEDGRPLGLVHRDINPTNLHVGYDGVCKIVDFGIAATRATAMRGTGQFAGKMSYMAPEQMTGDSVDARADIFAIGVLLYEISLGRRLFRGTPDDVRRRVLGGDIPAPTFIEPEYPPQLESIVMRALEVAPVDRYQNCDHMFRDLDRYLQETHQSWTPRKISAYMAELFGNGAPANLDYDDQYDDVVDDVLDFDQFDRIDAPADSSQSAPAWAQEVEGQNQSNYPKRAMTIGNIEAFVADMGSGGGASSKQNFVPKRATDIVVRRPHEESSSSVPDQDSESEMEFDVPVNFESSKESASVRKSAKWPKSPEPNRISGRHRAVANLSQDVESSLERGTFGHTVVSGQSKASNPLIWILLFIMLGGIGYFASTIFVAK